MQESDSLLGNRQYGTLEGGEINSGEMSNSPEHEHIHSNKRSIGLVAGILVSLTIMVAFILSSGSLYSTKISVEQSLATFAVVAPGEKMNNKDELWPCYPKSGGLCPQDNIYTARTVPFKMVFYNGDIYLFSRARCDSVDDWAFETMQESDSLLGTRQYGTLEGGEKNSGEMSKLPEHEHIHSNKRSIGVVAGILVSLTIMAAVILSSGGLYSTRNSVEQSLATFAVVAPGEKMNNKDELWPCYPKSGGLCPQDNIYTARTVPFKMVFYNGDIYLFSRARCDSVDDWAQLFEVKTAGNEAANSIGWGEPYWKLSEDPKISALFAPSFTPAQLVDEGLNNMVYRVNEKNQPQIAFQRATLVDDKAVFEDITVYTGQASPWGCDKVTFMLTTDGNLLLVPYSTTGKGGCGNNLPFVSKNYKALGGTTRVPTSEPTYGPGMPTPAPTPTFEPTLEPTTAPTAGATSAKKNGGNKKKNKNKKNKNKKNKNKPTAGATSAKKNGGNRKKNNKKKNKNKKNKNKKNKNKKNKNKKNKNKKNKNKNKSVTDGEDEEDIEDEEENYEDDDDDKYEDDDEEEDNEDLMKEDVEMIFVFLFVSFIVEFFKGFMVRKTQGQTAGATSAKKNGGNKKKNKNKKNKNKKNKNKKNKNKKNKNKKNRNKNKKNKNKSVTEGEDEEDIEDEEEEYEDDDYDEYEEDEDIEDEEDEEE
eukprot:CAMPEP_0182437284 /NCGR_PEP_ID=MMETSP1167-20130531/84940_1 /TAXON_ID=2988 /ORGANISM="Mallomonas Sp, Strain CCMP3275" /LENGTH=701 /DNA_ID=CAMNT_0024630143 /DNA_START=26 /DNA_END=2133 /DNA_ORIENTATION=+